MYLTEGFYLSVTKEKGKKLDDSLPDIFQRVQKNKNGFTFITEVNFYIILSKKGANISIIIVFSHDK